MFNNMWLRESGLPIVGDVVSGLEGVEQAVYILADVDANRKLAGTYLKMNFKSYNGGSSNMMRGLNPNVLNIDSATTTVADVSGILLLSPTDIALSDSSLPVPQKGNIVRVARLHSRVVVWMEVQKGKVATMADINTNAAVKINTTGGVDSDSTDTLAGAVFLSKVIDGQKIAWDNTTKTYTLQNCQVVAVGLF